MVKLHPHVLGGKALAKENEATVPSGSHASLCGHGSSHSHAMTPDFGRVL